MFVLLSSRKKRIGGKKRKGGKRDLKKKRGGGERNSFFYFGIVGSGRGGGEEGKGGKLTYSFIFGRDIGEKKFTGKRKERTEANSLGEREPKEGGPSSSFPKKRRKKVGEGGGRTLVG